MSGKTYDGFVGADPVAGLESVPTSTESGQIPMFPDPDEQCDERRSLSPPTKSSTHQQPSVQEAEDFEPLYLNQYASLLLKLVKVYHGNQHL